MARPPLRILWSADAVADLGRFADFLRDTAPDLALSIASEIISRTRIIGERPSIGRSIGDTAYRQFVIRASNSPYILQYLIDDDRVVILRVFHGRERRA